MSKQYPGGFITKAFTPPTSSAAPGIWTLDQAMQYQKAGNWPSPAAPVGGYVGSNVLSSTTPGSSFSTYTFSSVALGGTGTTKVIAVLYDGAGAITTISSATIGGVAATVRQVLYSGSWGQVAILTATGVSATTGDVVLNFAAPINTYGNGYFSTIALAKYSTNRTNIDPIQTSFGATPSVTANGNNRTSGLTICAFYSTNSNSTPGNVISNGNLTSNYSQNVTYNSALPAVDTYSAYSGVTNSSFTISGPSGSYQALAAITLN